MQPQFYDGVPAKRLLAFFVDALIIAALTLVILPFTAFIGLFFLPFLYMMMSFAYRVVTLARGSATWGMQLMAIELRTRDDKRFDFGMALLHTTGFAISVAIPILQIISIVMMLGSQRRQGLSDSLLGTVALNRRA